MPNSKSYLLPNTCFAEKIIIGEHVSFLQVTLYCQLTAATEVPFLLFNSVCNAARVASPNTQTVAIFIENLSSSTAIIFILTNKYKAYYRIDIRKYICRQVSCI